MPIDVKRPGASASTSAFVETTLIIVGLLVLLVALPFQISADGQERLRALETLLTTGKMPTTRYSLIGPLFSAPFWVLGHVVYSPVWWLERYNMILFAGGLASIYMLLRNRVDRRLLRIFFLLLIAASMFPNHLSNYYGEVFTALCVGIGMLAVVCNHERLGWTAVILGVANTPATLLGLVFICGVWVLVRRRWRYLLVVVLAVGLIALEAWVRRGSPLNSGYTADVGYKTVMPYSGLAGFSYPLLFGLLSILLSFGKGLVFFTPGMFLPVRKHLLSVGAASGALLRVYAVWLAFVCGLVLVYARWWAWYGGWFWGPRFFLFASLPASLVVAVRLRAGAASLAANLVTLVVLCLSVWVDVDGAVFDQATLGTVCRSNHYALELLCHYTPEFSALWRPFVVHETLDGKGILFIVYAALVALYLAVPLVMSITRQTRTLLQRLAKVYGPVSAWRL